MRPNGKHGDIEFNKKMRTSTRRWLGAGLIAASFVSFEVLTMFGIGQGPVVNSRSLSKPGAEWKVTVSEYEMHLPSWEKVGLIVVAGIGLSLLIVPGRERTNT